MGEASVGRRQALGLALVGIAVAACGGGDGDRTPSIGASPSTTVPPVPPDDLGRLRGVVESWLAPSGLVVTRASVRDSATAGPHLAVYAEPAESEGWDDQRFLDTVVPSAAAFFPAAFDRWSGIGSADLCLEPTPEENDDEAPPVKTQLVVTRAGSASVDWPGASLAALIGASIADPVGVRIVVARPLNQLAKWVDAVQEAGQG